MAKRMKLGDIFIDSFFQYSITMTYVVGTETLTNVIPIQSDADFICVHSMYDDGHPSSAAAAQAAANIPANFTNGGSLVKLTDGATQRDLTNLVGGVPASCLFGTAQQPYMWPLTHRFRANTPIGFQITGQTVLLAALNQRFVLGGFKIPLGTYMHLAAE